VSRLLPVLATAALLGCSPAPEARSTWTARDFLALAHAADLDFGGLGHLGGPGSASAMVALEGEPIPFRSPPHAAQAVLQASGAGLPVQPAYAQGAPAGFVVTEVWDNQPLPWVQPVYLAPGAVAGTYARVVFPVDVGGSFYSPFWRAEVLGPPPGTDAGSFPKSATGVLDTGWPLTASALVYCAIVPDRLTVASAAGDPVGSNGAARLVQPFTGEPLAEGPLSTKAWVDDRLVRYLPLGFENTPSDGQRLWAAPMYFFSQASASGERRLLPFPPVLPDAPEAHALVQRVDVTLPPGSAAYAPPALRAGLATALATPGFPDLPLATDVDPGIDPALARKYLLRVALDPACFKAGGGFPGSCTWLDSAQAVTRLPAASLQPRTVYLAVRAVRGAP
jgi:hypothetical protein